MGIPVIQQLRVGAYIFKANYLASENIHWS